MPLPNFIIIGAAKAGTTSLFRYVNEHPEVYMSPVKEPRFFSLEGLELDPNDPVQQTAVTTFEEYRRLFDGVTTQKAIGEASPMYLWSEQAPAKIKKYVPEAKLIAILRNPIDRAYSHYTMNVYQSKETAPTIIDAIKEEEVDIKGWKRTRPYVPYSLYSQQLERYYEVFPREQLRVYLFDDLKQDAIGLMRDLFSFIGVDVGFTPDTTKRYNPTAVPRFRWLQGLIRSKGASKSLFKEIVPKSSRSKITSLINKRNLVRIKMSREEREALVPLFNDDVLRLQEMLQRDLSHWLEV